MGPEDWSRVKAVFDAAILVSKSERSSYLGDLCPNDFALQREVKELLESFDLSEDFMERPFAAEVTQFLSENELEPGQIFNRYRIVRRIGVGGMGKVYLAQDTHLKRLVAIKLLSADATGDPDHLARFVQEARFASALNHPNIVTVYEIGQDGDVHFISTEFVVGPTLRQQLSQAPLQVSRSLDIAIQITSALVVAHEAEIVHRDIKPENIMLREDGYLKVLDFGLAKLSRNQAPFAGSESDKWRPIRTDPGFIMGTVNYMSPEQARGIGVDERTDIWSMGVVLYEMLTSKPPFEGLTSSDVMAAILKQEPEQITEIVPGIPGGLEHIVEKALSKSLDERYQKMTDMLLDLKVVRSDLDLQLKRESPAERGPERRSNRKRIARGTEATDVPVHPKISQPRSIAILPFTNLTGDRNVSFYEFSLADAVITELARQRSLVVRPSSVVAKYIGHKIDPLEVGKQLNVDAILSTSFLSTKKRVRVNTQLIDVRKGNILWGESMDSTADDIISVQDAISVRIAEKLKLELRRSAHPAVTLPATTSPRAYEEYLLGRDQYRQYVFHTVAEENVEAAIAHFKCAIDLDPNFALAHCALGTSLIQRVLKGVGVGEDLGGAATAFDHALALDSDLNEARAYRALVLRFQGNAEASREQLSGLRRDAPNNFEAQYMSAASYRLDGDYENAFRCYSEMLRLDPTAKVSVHCFRARFFWYQGKYEQAFHELDEGKRLAPNHPFVGYFHAIVTFLSGHPGEAAESLKSLLEVYPLEGFRPLLSMCRSALGDRESALDELTQRTESVAAANPDVSYGLASAYLMAGKTDLALHWLKYSIDHGYRNRPWLESSPTWTSMHRDPRFTRLTSGLIRPTLMNRN